MPLTVCRGWDIESALFKLFQAGFSYGFACLPWAPLPIRQFLTDSHIWSSPACSGRHSATRRVLPGAVFSATVLEGGLQHPFFCVVSRQCLGRVCALTSQKERLSH